LHFSAAGCANRLISLVGHGASEDVLASDAVRIIVLLLLAMVLLLLALTFRTAAGGTIGVRVPEVVVF